MTPSPRFVRSSPQVRQELVRLHDLHGILRPEDVVAEAADTASVLHPFFTWDRTEAARQWNLAEARQLIRFQIQYEPNIQRDITFFVSLRADRVVDGGGYRIQLEVFDNAALRAQRLHDALRELQHFREKYADLEQLAAVFRAVNNVVPPTTTSASPPPAAPPPPMISGPEAQI
jgi:hypothetical protein